MPSSAESTRPCHRPPTRNRVRQPHADLRRTPKAPSGARDRGIHVAVIGTRAQLVAAFAVLMAFGWWVTAQPPFSVAGTVGVLVAGAALIGLARLWRRRAAPPCPATAQTRTSGSGSGPSSWCDRRVGADHASFGHPRDGAPDHQLHHRLAAGRTRRSLAVLRRLARDRLVARGMTSRADHLRRVGRARRVRRSPRSRFRVTTRRIPTLGRCNQSARAPAVRAGLCLAAWLWAGWHFFVRSSR